MSARHQAYDTHQLGLAPAFGLRRGWITFSLPSTASNKGESPCRSSPGIRTWNPPAASARAAVDSAVAALVVFLTSAATAARHCGAAAPFLAQLETRITLSLTTLASFIAPTA